MNKDKKRSKYPPYPSSGWDYAVQHTASTLLRKPNKCICIYCHGQAITEQEIVHQPDCPAASRIKIKPKSGETNESLL